MINSIKDVKSLLQNNGLRYHSIIKQIQYPVQFKVVMENLTDEHLIKIQSILDLGIKNITFEEIDFY